MEYSYYKVSNILTARLRIIGQLNTYVLEYSDNLVVRK
jgi:hypothetical protein